MSVAPPALLGGDEELHAVREAVTRRIREKLRGEGGPGCHVFLSKLNILLLTR